MINGNAYNQNNGRGASAPPPVQHGTRTKVTFDPPRVPVILRPEGVPAHPVEGRTGPQYMWLFEDNQIAWFDPHVHREMVACLEMNPEGTELAITKLVRRGTPPRFEVQPVAQIEEPLLMPEKPRATRSQQPSGFDPPPPAPRKPAPVVPRFHYEEPIESETAGADQFRRRTPTSTPPTPRTPPDPAKEMASALIAAIVAIQEAMGVALANGIEFKPTPAQIIDVAKIIFKAED